METLVKKGALGTILCSSGIITEKDITAALEEQRASGGRFGEALVKLGIVKQEDIDWALSNQLDIPYVRLSDKIIDRAATRLITPELARKYNLIPIIRSGDELHIALADPLNRAAVEEVELVTGCKVTVSIPIIRELREMLDLFYGPEEELLFGFASAAFSGPMLDKINADPTGMKLLECLILFFFKNGLATLSLQPAGGTVRVSGRRRGGFREIGHFPVASYPALLSYLRKVSRINGAWEKVSEGRLLFTYHGSDVVLRVSMLKAVEGECVTLRVYNDRPLPEDLEELGLDSAIAGTLRSLVTSGTGMVLLCSFNRAIRNRFLDLLLDEGRAGNGNVMLLGEGIGKGKRPYPRISLPHETPEDTAALIPALLDHDPDVIAVEEATDGRSFRSAWESAMHGKRVLIGLSLGSLESCLAYLLGTRTFNPTIASGIRGIVAVNEVNTLCRHCGPGKARPDEQPPQGDPHGQTRPAGCEHCGFTGLGRGKYLLDAVPFDEGFRDAFNKAGRSSDLLAHLAGQGYRDLDRQLRDLLEVGEISREEFELALGDRGHD